MSLQMHFTTTSGKMNQDEWFKAMRDLFRLLNVRMSGWYSEKSIPTFCFDLYDHRDPSHSIGRIAAQLFFFEEPLNFSFKEAILENKQDIARFLCEEIRKITGNAKLEGSMLVVNIQNRDHEILLNLEE